MSAIGPGDFVECFKRPTCFCGCEESGLTVGAIYQVAEINVGTPTGILLVSPPPPEGHYAFHIRFFRPIYRPNQELISSLLRDAPVSVPA